MNVVVVFLLLFKLIAEIKGATSPIVTTKTGQIRGLLVQTTESPINNRVIDVYQFTSVPFAAPPIGSLRFKKPQPIQPWNKTGVLEATKTPTACTQHSTRNDGRIEEGSEDCLLLNIWVPRVTLDAVISNQPNRYQLSVFVFIHGGNFLEGSTTAEATYNGTFLAGFNDVIVVTIQYRLGSLGFGYLGNEEVPGNMGLWDQLEALRWINENIASFGGNSNQVTIGGQSAGAASVTNHLLSPHSRKYFQRAIIQSGASNAVWGTRSSESARNITNIVFKALCNETNTTSLSVKMQCLRQIDAARFPILDRIPSAILYSDIVFGPVIDGDFIPRDPVKMLVDGDFYKVPILIGANKDEGSMFLMLTPMASEILPSVDAPYRTLDSLTYANYQDLIRDRFHSLGSPATNPLILQAVQAQYWPRDHEGLPNGPEIFQSASDADGDFGLVCPVFSWANLTSASFGGGGSNKVFAYYFTHRRVEHWAPDYMGVLHGDELSFIFGELFAPPTPESLASTEQEKRLSLIMMTYWTNFMKFGDPNGPSSIVQTRLWPPYVGQTCSQQYFELNVITQVTNQTTTEAIICELKRRACYFWQDFIAKIATITTPSTPCNCTTPSSKVVCPKNAGAMIDVDHPTLNNASPFIYCYHTFYYAVYLITIYYYLSR